jgi:hypothetical protein
VTERHLLPDEIDLLLDGEAGFGVAPLKAHVRRCEHCRLELETARAVVAELEHLPHLGPSPLFTDRVLQQVQVFEPWHVAALDNVRRLVPQSRPARLLAATGALSFAAMLTVATLWIAARIDILVLLTGAAGDRTRQAIGTAAGDAFRGLLGGSPESLLGSGGIGALAVLSAFLISLVAAAAGLRLAAAASRRRR